MSKRGIQYVRAEALPQAYPALLEDIKRRIRTAQIKAALSVNRELIQLYWDIGRAIAARQKSEGWGTRVMDRLGADLQREFPGIAGFSRGNIYRMRSFYLAYRTSSPIVAQAARQSGGDAPPEPMASLPWFHNVVLLEQLDELRVRHWYGQQALANGWSRSMLEHWIESDLYARQGKAVTNFQQTLPAAQSDLVRQVLKDPYNFDFLTLRQDAAERELEDGLTGQITRFLLELGEGFAFVGRQIPLTVDGEDSYIDLHDEAAEGTGGQTAGGAGD